MRMLVLVAAAAVCATAATAATAAETLDLVGTWKSTGDFGGITAGVGTKNMPTVDAPMFLAPADAWSVVIKEQQGRAFHGVSRSPKGGEESLVGVISADGKHLLIAGEEGGLFGEVLGDKIEFCFQDQKPDRQAVACYVAAKE